MFSHLNQVLSKSCSIFEGKGVDDSDSIDAESSLRTKKQILELSKTTVEVIYDDI